MNYKCNKHLLQITTKTIIQQYKKLQIQTHNYTYKYKNK